MTSALLVVGVVVVLVGWDHYMYRAAGRRRWNPLWMAFTLTTVAVLYGVGGLLGYSVPAHNPFISHRAVWVGHIVWPQVRFGVLFGLASVIFWRAGLKQL